MGCSEHLTRISAEILAENTGMQRICQKFGFRINRTSDISVMKAEIDL
ncbi:hypothetical protein [Calothrix sp. 336/3]|nr:hypothetical protein [Calothrix sp. 336/3]